MLAIANIWRYREGVPTTANTTAPVATGPAQGTGPGRRGRRQQILRCAAQLFATRGFHGVSAAAGITGPALYRHFRAKEDILAELLVGVSKRLLEGGRSRVDAARGAEQALAALVEFHVEFALDEPDVITVQERDLASLPPAANRTVRALQNAYVSVWADVLEQLAGGRRDRAVAVAHAAFGLMNSTPHSARLPRPQMALLLRQMADAALRGASVDR